MLLNLAFYTIVLYNDSGLFFYTVLLGDDKVYYKDLLRYRPVWLGCALLWVILFHCPLDHGPLYALKVFGYGGVDICLFASGIGCFYSLSSDSDVFNFMKRRIKRLAPTYVIFITFWLLHQYVIGDFRIQMAIGNILAIQNFTGLGHDFNWYVSAIFLMYILAPYFKAIVEKATPVKRIAFLAFLLACSIPFWNENTYLVTITRIPIFYIGMMFADICKKDKQIRKKEVVFMAISFILGVLILMSSFIFAKQYLGSFGLYWYPFILITPPLCVAISYVSMFLEKAKITKLIVRFLSLCGDYSFELYLVHIPMFSIIPAFFAKFIPSGFSYLTWIAYIVAIIIGCYLLRYLTALFNRLCNSIKHR